jgi:metal-responsive CopG/Arc/MetJ family transcriptional regulator
MMIGLMRIDLRLPDELVEKTDILAKLEYKNRTDIIKSALTEYLRKVAATQLREKAVESYLDNKLTYNELAVVIGRQNAESVKVSKRLLERSDRIAEDIARG